MSDHMNTTDESSQDIIDRFGEYYRERTGGKLSSSEAWTKLKSMTWEGAPIATWIAQYDRGTSVAELIDANEGVTPADIIAVPDDEDALEAYYFDVGASVLGSYASLHALPHIDAAITQHSVDAPSYNATKKAIFQCAEIAMQNMILLLDRLSDNLEEKSYERAAVNMLWLGAYHETLAKVTGITLRQGRSGHDKDVMLDITDSPTHAELIAARQRCDVVIHALNEEDIVSVDIFMTNNRMDNPLYRTLHHTVLGNSLSDYWSRILASPSAQTESLSPDRHDRSAAYVEFVGTAHLKQAVTQLQVVDRDGYFTQFRGLHQIPEIMVDLGIKHIRQAMADIHDGHLAHAAYHLATTMPYFAIMRDAVLPMQRSLSTGAYQDFRPFLGETSGSHSENLRKTTFLRLYPELWEALEARVAARAALAGRSVEEEIRFIDENRFNEDDREAMHLAQIFDHVADFRATVLEWTLHHFNFVRTQLGTIASSISRSPKGADVAEHFLEMRHGEEHDPYVPLLNARGIPAYTPTPPVNSLAHYHKKGANDNPSGDQLLLGLISGATQETFQDVEKRAKIIP